MAISTTRDTTLNATQLITQALRKIQVGVGGETLAAEYLSRGLDALNLMIKQWAVDGVRLWLEEEQAITAVSGTATYTLSPRALEVIRAYRRVSNNDTPVRVVSREEYDRVPNKTIAGAPYMLFPVYGRTSTTVTMYPVPGATEIADALAIYAVIKRQIVDVTAGTEETEFPAQWQSALVHNLAVWMCPEFNKEPSPRLAQLAQDSYDILAASDREGSVTMGPAPGW